MRRSDAQYGLVNFPDGLKDTGEGGIEIWALAISREAPVRSICVTGFDVGIVEWDAVATTWLACNLRSQWDRGKFKQYPFVVQGAVCLGATGRSLYDEVSERYWQASRADLTDEGKALYDSLCLLYGDIELATVLDT